MFYCGLKHYIALFSWFLGWAGRLKNLFFNWMIKLLILGKLSQKNLLLFGHCQNCLDPSPWVLGYLRGTFPKNVHLKKSASNNLDLGWTPPHYWPYNSLTICLKKNWLLLGKIILIFFMNFSEKLYMFWSSNLLFEHQLRL